MIFAGRDGWEFVGLQVKVEDEIQWGPPARAQLVWLLHEHKRYGVVVPGRKRVRFFLYWLGEIRELEKKEFRLEPVKKKGRRFLLHVLECESLVGQIAMSSSITLQRNTRIMISRLPSASRVGL